MGAAPKEGEAGRAADDETEGGVAGDLPDEEIEFQMTCVVQVDRSGRFVELCKEAELSATSGATNILLLPTFRFPCSARLQHEEELVHH
jgi:hypothetical protein